MIRCIRTLLFQLAIFLTVIGFTFVEYTLSISNNKTNIFVVLLYIIFWAALLLFAWQVRSFPALITSLVYWILVLTMSCASVGSLISVASEILLYKFLTLPSALALMPFSGVSGSNSIGPIAASALIISLAFIFAICLIILNYYGNTKKRSVLFAAIPIFSVIFCMSVNISEYGEAFLAKHSSMYWNGVGVFNVLVSGIYIIIWICVLVATIYTGAKRIAAGSFIFWFISTILSLLLMISGSEIQALSVLALSPLFGFCPLNGYPGTFGGISFFISFLMLIVSYICCKGAAGKRDGYITKKNHI